MGQAKYQTDGDPRTSGPGFGVALHEDTLTEPLRWRKPRVCFVDSMADIAHVKVPADFLAQVWALMALTPQHTYQILTKRPERYRRVLDGPCRCGGGHQPGVDFRRLAEDHARRLAPGREVDLETGWPLPNVWLGVRRLRLAGGCAARRARCCSLPEPGAVVGAAAEPGPLGDRLGDRGWGERPGIPAVGPGLGS